VIAHLSVLKHKKTYKIIQYLKYNIILKGISLIANSNRFRKRCYYW